MKTTAIEAIITCLVFASHTGILASLDSGSRAAKASNVSLGADIAGIWNPAYESSSSEVDPESPPNGPGYSSGPLRSRTSSDFTLSLSLNTVGTQSTLGSFALSEPEIIINPNSSSGNPNSTSGNPNSTSGNPNSTSGNPNSTSGNPNSTSGNPNSTSGNPNSTSGNPNSNTVRILKQVLLSLAEFGEIVPHDLSPSSNPNSPQSSKNVSFSEELRREVGRDVLPSSSELRNKEPVKPGGARYATIDCREVDLALTVQLNSTADCLVTGIENRELVCANEANPYCCGLRPKFNVFAKKAPRLSKRAGRFRFLHRSKKGSKRLFSWTAKRRICVSGTSSVRMTFSSDEFVLLFHEGKAKKQPEAKYWTRCTIQFAPSVMDWFKKKIAKQ